jgi:NAD(P)-dependent dehydrogenase (short-subunit alcohol dehydrogenase family)
MPVADSMTGPTELEAHVVTGPTSGIGRATALELANHGTVVLVNRAPKKLDEVRRALEKMGQRAVPVVCDLSDISSVRRAAAEIVALRLPIVGLQACSRGEPRRPPRGWDTTFATNHLGPFVLTEALISHLPDRANIVFVASGVEDPERKPAVAAGFRGGRYISAEASARGEWTPGGSTMPGADAYATSKQCILAAAMELARENPRLRINAVEPGFTPATNLGREANAFLRFLAKYILPMFAPFVKYWSTPKRAARVITKVLISKSNQTRAYYDDGGHPMLASDLAGYRIHVSRCRRDTRLAIDDSSLNRQARERQPSAPTTTSSAAKTQTDRIPL